MGRGLGGSGVNWGQRILSGGVGHAVWGYQKREGKKGKTKGEGENQTVKEDRALFSG